MSREERKRHFSVWRDSINDGRHCDFCGRDESEIRTLIVGPDVYICDSCIEICQRIISERNAVTAQPQGAAAED
jgi:hypothetical protein